MMENLLSYFSSGKKERDMKGSYSTEVMKNPKERFYVSFAAIRK